MNFILLVLLKIFTLSIDIGYGENLKVICYWTSNHKVEDINPHLCTHIHYSFFVLDEGKAAPVDELGYPNKEVYDKLNALKQTNPDLKIIPAIGGWGDEADKYSRVMANETTRNIFVNNTIQLVDDYNFDGFDLDWEFPVCWQDDCDAGDKADKDNFSKLIKELREEFDKSSRNLSLSAAVKGDEIISTNAYNFEDLDKYLDYVSVMTYDDYGFYSKINKTQHHSAFQYSIDSLEFYHNKGVSKQKLLIGVPFYGRSFTLIDASDNKIGSPIKPILPNIGAPTEDFVIICQNVKKGNWTKGYGNGTKDPYAYYDTFWIGYDDPFEAFTKAKFVKDNGYGGVIIWEIGIDDIKKNCCTTDYPLLRAINYGLFDNGNNPNDYGCDKNSSGHLIFNFLNLIACSLLITIKIALTNF